MPVQTVLVTGARGQLGRHLLARGAAAGLRIRGAGSEEADITDPGAVAALVEPGAVVLNCAA